MWLPGANILLALLTTTVYARYHRHVTHHTTKNSTFLEDNTRDSSSDDNSVVRACSKPSLQEAPLRCPNNYGLLYIDGWFRLCKPVACAEVNYFDNFTINGQPEDICIEHINKLNNTAKICANNQFREPTDNFRKCSKKLLQESLYEILSNGSLWNIEDQALLPLSEYFPTDNGTVLICDGNDTGDQFSSDPNSILPWCIPIPDMNNSDQHQSADSLITAGYSSLKSSNITETTCIKTSASLSKCESFTAYRADQFEKDDNDAVTNYRTLKSYPFGNYFVNINQTIFYVCKVPPPEMTIIKKYLYGSALIISAISLSLVLLIYLFYPKLSYRNKDVLCLVISYFIMYLITAVRYIIPPSTDEIRNVSLFCILYIFAMSTFFWLNVIAFGLWRVFSQFKGPTVANIGTSNKKNAFLAKGIYAWGIPVLMCVTAVVISYSHKAQHILHIRISLQYYGWFKNTKVLVLLFHGPMVIILIENLIFFILTVIKIRKDTRDMEMVNKKKSRKLLRIFIKFFFVTGLCWFAEFISIIVGDHAPEEIWYVTDIVNSLQGFFIFIVYVCKRSTLKLLKKRLNLIQDDDPETMSTNDDSTTRTSFPMSTMKDDIKT